MPRTMHLSPRVAAAAAATIALTGAASAQAAPKWTPAVTLAGPTETDSYYYLSSASGTDGSPLTTWGEYHPSTSTNVGGASALVGGAPVASFLDPSAQNAFSLDEGSYEHLVTLPSGNILAVLTATDVAAHKERLVTSEYSPATHSWSPLTSIAADPDSTFEYPSRVVVTPNGDVTVVYYRQPNIATHRALAPTYQVASVTRKAGSSAWSAPVSVAELTGNANQDAFAAVATSDGRVVTVWHDYDSTAGAYVLRSATLSASGAWAAPVNVTDPATYNAYLYNGQPLDLATDGAGNVTLAWNDGSASAIFTSDLKKGATAWATKTRADGLASGEPSGSVSISENAAGDTLVGWSADGSKFVASGAGTATRSAGDDTWTSQTLNATVFFTGSQAPVTSVAPDGAMAIVGNGGDQVVAYRKAAGADTFGGFRRLDGPDTYAPENGDSHWLTGTTNADGSLTVSWNALTPSDGKRLIRSTTWDQSGPIQSGVTVPATATVNVPAAFSLTAKDVASATGDTTWSFGDGSAIATGTSVKHSYTAPGTYTVKASSTDALGNTTKTSKQITVSGAACTGARSGSKVTVQCKLGFVPGAKVKINGKIQRVKKDGTLGPLRAKARTTTSTGNFTFSFNVRAARKGLYTVTITPKGWTRQTVNVKL